MSVGCKYMGGTYGSGVVSSSYDVLEVWSVGRVSVIGLRWCRWWCWLGPGSGSEMMGGVMSVCVCTAVLPDHCDHHV